MDARDVDEVLRRNFWPDLRAAGFARRSGRTAWREGDRAIQCITVQSFSSYLAGRLRATTFSFSVYLGVFFAGIAARTAMGKFVKDASRAKEYECQLRKVLEKGLHQPSTSLVPEWDDRPDIWLVLPDGSNVGMVVEDAAVRVREVGLPWLDQCSDPAEATTRFLSEPDHFVEGVLTEHYGGTVGSPSRLSSVGALAAAVGDQQTLSLAVNAMTRDTYFEGHPHDLAVLRSELASVSRDIAAR